MEHHRSKSNKSKQRKSRNFLFDFDENSIIKRIDNLRITSVDSSSSRTNHSGTLGSLLPNRERVRKPYQENLACASLHPSSFLNEGKSSRGGLQKSGMKKSEFSNWQEPKGSRSRTSICNNKEIHSPNIQNCQKFRADDISERQGLIKSQCSSLRSSLSSIASVEEIDSPKNRRNYGKGRNWQEPKGSRSRTSICNNKEIHSPNIQNCQKFRADDISERQGLIKSQCSSLRSSASSIVSIGEDNMFEKRTRNSRGMKYQNHERNKDSLCFTRSSISSLIKQNDDLLTRTLFRNKTGFKNIFTSYQGASEMAEIFKLLVRIGDLSDESTKEYLLSFSLNREFINNISNYLPCILMNQTNEKLIKNFEDIYSYVLNIINIIPLETLNDFDELFKKALSSVEGIGNLSDKSNKISQIISDKLKVHEIQLDIANLCVFPSIQDLSESPELHPNIVKGPYPSPSFYLNNHFKLYKEDFVSGLRDGLQEFENNKKEKKFKRLKDIFLYEAIYCGLSKLSRKDNLAYRFEINNKKLKNVDWSTSKRLIHGSLLLISNDEFKTFYYALLDDKGTPKGEKSFHISAAVINKLITFKKYTECLIIEPRVFFHPYHQVLKTFKKIDHSMFPMERYIISVDLCSGAPCYINDDTNYIINGSPINIHNSKSFENHETLGLNKSQISALEAALTKEFVIIQGPPGTGKSFLGLKIIKILLDNNTIWKTGYSPILVICYRNNAVDQILETLIKEGRSVVRLGSQSSNEIVKERCLRTAVKAIRSNRSIQDQIVVLKTEIDSIKSKISHLQLLTIFIKDRKGILRPETLSEVLTEKQIKYFLHSNAYEDWLLGGSHENDDLQNCNEEIYEDLFNEKSENYLESMELQRSVWFNVYQLKNEIIDIRNRINQISDDFNEEITGNKVPAQVLCFVVELLQQLQEKEMFLKKIINRINLKTEEFIDPSYLNDKNLSALSLPERWKLYDYWSSTYSAQCEGQIEELFLLINQKLDDLEELNGKNDGYKIRCLQPDVVGATTTGAARLYSLMNVIRPKIVVFEEAAEVLEAHSITALTSFCEHLIMIGDHQQLRPNPSSHASVVKYRLDISLFERMIMNGMQYYSLNEQHRMRPLISSLVIPQFYPHLSNHESVEKYPDVKGLRDNMFFLDHTIPEDKLTDSESHRNKFEANFALVFTDYLLKQGYEEKDITILTFYGAQLFYLKSLRNEYPSLKKVSIEVVDNFQGEENRIIVLSLVRSNPFSIGFLSKMNRICVALTRAKEGFYMIGNMSTLKGNSEVWKGIDDTLKKQNIIGNDLPLKCNTHGTVTLVRSEVDFVPLKFGGCTLKCGIKLDCGHICDQLCHGSDENHMLEFTCKKPCQRKRNCNIHDCEEACGVPCPKCDVLLESQLPCGHMGMKVCAGDSVPCSTICSDPLPCGHPCYKTCHFPAEHLNEVCSSPCGLPNKSCPVGHKCKKPCGEDCGDCEIKTLTNLPCGHVARGKCKDLKNKKCKVPIEKDLDCGHTMEVECCKPISEVECDKNKSQLMECGHSVEVPCSSKGLNEELLCKHKVMKVLPCGHTKEVLCCFSNNENLLCEELVQKELDCEHGFKNAKCSTPADKVVCLKKVVKTAKCGHKIKIPCHEKSKTIPCNQPCGLMKSCGHKCGGICGEPCPDCQEPVEIVEKCGHIGQIPCSTLNNDNVKIEESLGSKDCPTPCGLKLSCGHKCTGTCGTCMQGRAHEPCLEICGERLICGHMCSAGCNVSIHLCQQNCLNKCDHQSCTKMCGEPCNKCIKPCSWKCEHFECTRLCWEDCNRELCTIPCKELLTCGHNCNGFCGEPCPQICLECSPNSYLTGRYILLEDCGHSLPYNEFLFLLPMAIGMFLCPICQQPQTKSNYIRFYSKNWFKLLPRIQKRISRKFNDFGSLAYDLKGSLNKLHKVLKKDNNGFKELQSLLEEIVRQIKGFMLHQRHYNIESLRSLLFVSYFICETFNFLQDSDQNNNSDLLSRINHLAYYLKLQSSGISRDQMFQFNDELLRLFMLTNLSKIKERVLDPTKKEYFEQAWKLVCDMKQFNEEEKNQVSSIMTKMSIKQIDTSLIQNKFLYIFEKYPKLSLHKKSWVKCNKSGHLIFKTVVTSESVDCPQCLKRGEFLF